MFDDAWENSMPQIRQWLEDTGLPAWHPPKRKGFFRYLVVRKSFKQNLLLINLVTSSEALDRINIREFADFIRKLHPGRIAGILHTINDDIADRTDPLNGKSMLLFGGDKIEESILGLSFEISMKSFFQTNPKSAEKLYAKAMDYAALHFDAKDSIMLDLFCGTGTIAQLLARRFQCEVVGVDIVPEAIENARENAKRNHLEGLTFIAADVGKFLPEHPEYANRIQTLVIDPPRAGIAPKTLAKIIALGAENLVYISCNPATQARDTETLYLSGYRMEKLSFVDQFPHTSHIESVALYRKNLF
jgi:23S rRNA (uracil-5-)-methyltransferase RumA